jgi:hypothetical protein
LGISYLALGVADGIRTFGPQAASTAQQYG